MKYYMQYDEWQPRLFPEKAGIFKINAITAKPQRATWAPLDQSGFIDYVNEMNVDPAEQSLQLQEQIRAAFGYAKRVSELCNRLERIEVILLDVVKRLDRTAQPERSLWVPIESFAPEPYEIIRPITAVVTPVEDGFEAGLFDAEIFASGDTEAEADNNLKSVILETYADLHDLGDSKLGPGPLRQKNALSNFIRRVE